MPLHEIVLSLFTLIVATMAAVFSFLAYRRKSGIRVQGSFSVMSSIEAKDWYIHQVTLENLKDRAVVIYKIFLEIPHGYYIQIDDFEDDPLVLKPYAVFRKHYEPIDFYSVGGRRIRIDDVLNDRSTRRRLVLVTSLGRYNIDRPSNYWDPLIEVFRNHYTVIVTPLRSTYEGKSYGSGTKYIVRIESIDALNREFIPIYPRDYRVRKFRNFMLTPESLRSRKSLEEFLLERAVAGELRCSDVSVFDLEEWRRLHYQDFDKETVDAEPLDWLTYNFRGWITTRWRDFALNRRNRKK